MTLAEFSSKSFTTPGNPDTVTTLVFEDEGSADSWLDDHLNGGDNRDALVMLTLHSDMKPEAYLKPEICDREVEMVWAVAKDVLAIVVGGAKE